MTPFHLKTAEEVRELAKTTKKPKPEAPVYPAATEPVTLRLALPPSINHYYREQGILKGWKTTKTGKRVPDIMVIKPIMPPGRAYRAMVAAEWREKVGRTYFGPLAIRVNVVWPDRRDRNMDNLTKCLYDALEQAGAFPNDKELRLQVLDDNGVEKPGWVTVTLGTRPGDTQGTLFDVNW